MAEVEIDFLCSYENSVTVLPFPTITGHHMKKRYPYGAFLVIFESFRLNQPRNQLKILGGQTNAHNMLVIEGAMYKKLWFKLVT